MINLDRETFVAILYFPFMDNRLILLIPCIFLCIIWICSLVNMIKWFLIVLIYLVTMFSVQSSDFYIFLYILINNYSFILVHISLEDSLYPMNSIWKFPIFYWGFQFISFNYSHCYFFIRQKNFFWVYWFLLLISYY
jgi:hypothetical protein